MYSSSLSVLYHHSMDYMSQMLKDNSSVKLCIVQPHKIVDAPPTADNGIRQRSHFFIDYIHPLHGRTLSVNDTFRRQFDEIISIIYVWFI